MTALLAPAVGPDLTSDYWRLKQLPAFTTVINGVRVNYDHLQRVQRARMAVETVEGSAALVVEDR